MIKHLSKISGVAAFAVIASSASAEYKFNEYISFDGYATAAAVATEPSPAVKDKAFADSGRPYDSAKVAVNGKYGDFTSKLSVIGYKSSNASTDTIADVGVLDAFVTYKTGDYAITGGKFLSFLGYESFDTPNNAFISFSNANYLGNYATGAKVEKITKDYSTGLSVRDSINAGKQKLDKGSFFEGDGDFSDDLGSEAYFLYTGIDKVQVFLGAGYENTDGAGDTATYDAWVSYALTDKLTLVAEYAKTSDAVDYSWNALASYALTSELSVAARVTGSQADRNNIRTTPPIGIEADYFGYGVASTYTVTKNFALKAEVTKNEANKGIADVFSYALQGVLKF